MGYMNDEIPLLDNHSDAAIVDETGLVKQVKKAVEKAPRKATTSKKTPSSPKKATREKSPSRGSR